MEEQTSTVGRSVRASIDFNGPLNALSTSPNKKLIAVGGRDVLKIVSLGPKGFSEKRNLRVGKASLKFSTIDIRWHPHLSSLLATAATNGSVVIWNLKLDGAKQVQDRVFNGHRRAVNRICWHPDDGNLLLSGSQDGTVKLWDRRGTNGNTYQSKESRESVRDVRIKPHHNSNKFAAAFENGIVQLWDMRQTAQPEEQFTAHKGLMLALEWHPSKPNILATGGRDKYLKVWDLEDVRQPKRTIQTIASVGRVAWRPENSQHIASSASITDHSVLVWDTQQPYIPVAAMKSHTDIVSGIEWLDTPVSPSFASNYHDKEGEFEGQGYWQHMLACSKDGTLKLHSLADAVKPHQSLPTTALALNSTGEVAFSHDYIDRTCASLRIHRHLDMNSSLFTVTDTPQKGNGTVGKKKQSSKRPSNGWHGSDLSKDSLASQNDHDTESTARSYGSSNPHAEVPRPLTLGRASSSSGNLMSLAHSGSNLLSGSQLPTKSPQYDQPPYSGGIPRMSSTGGAQHFRNDWGRSNSDRIRSETDSTLERRGSGLHYVNGQDGSQGHLVSPTNVDSDFLPTTTPKALISIVSMESAAKAKQLESIFYGDEQAFAAAEEQLERLKSQFQQSGQLRDAFGFDEHAFRFLATNYKLFDGKGVKDMDNAADQAWTFPHMCAHNALAAFVCGKSHLSQMWRILDVLYASESDLSKLAQKELSRVPLQRETTTERAIGRSSLIVDPSHTLNSAIMEELQQQHDMESLDDQSQPSANDTFGPGDDFAGVAGTTQQAAMLLEQLDHVNPQAMQGFDPYPHESGGGNGNNSDISSARFAKGAPSGKSMPVASTAVVNGSAVNGQLSHVRDSILKELLEYYGQKGDLQSCVAVAVVAGKVTNVEKLMGTAWMQQTYMHYVDMLHQLQIYSAANEVVANCSDASIRQMNMKSTTIYLNCSKCSKSFEAYSASSPSGQIIVASVCQTCSNKPTCCSVCELPVRGLYAWCTGCSHGGHLEHLQEWFAVEDTCPTGCSHHCSLQMSAPTI